MNRKWTILAIAALALGALAFGVTRHAVCRDSGTPQERLQDVSRLSRSLDLSDAQVEQIKALHTALGSQVNDCGVRHCAARARLSEALANETNGVAHADAIVAEMCRAYEQSERATLNHIRAVRALLTAEQKRRFDVMVSRCVCGQQEMAKCRGSAMTTASHRPTGEGHPNCQRDRE